MSQVDEQAIAPHPSPGDAGARKPRHIHHATPHPTLADLHPHASRELIESYLKLVAHLKVIERSLARRRMAERYRIWAAHRHLPRAVLLSVIAAIGLALTIGQFAGPLTDRDGQPRPAQADRRSDVPGRDAAPIAPQPPSNAPPEAATHGEPNSLSSAPRGEPDRAGVPAAAKAEAKPTDAAVERGEAWLKQGDWARATNALNEAIRADYANPLAYRARAQAHIGKGDTDLAIVDLTHAIQFARMPSARMSAVELFLLYRTRAVLYDIKQLYDRELADLDDILSALARIPQLAEQFRLQLGPAGATNFMASVYDLRAKVHVQRQDFPRARDDLTAAIQAGPEIKLALYLERANVTERLGDRAAAADDYRQALSIDPGSQEARTALARLDATAKP